MNATAMCGPPLLLCVLFPLSAQSDVPANSGHAAATLVERLGDDSFGVREEAANQLRSLGRAAVDALRAGLRSTDREIRRRCQELLAQAIRSDLDIDLDAFVAAPRDAKGPAPAGWTRFKTLAGDDKASRLLFTQLMREDKALLELLEKDHQALASQLTNRIRQVQQKYSNARGAGDSSPGASADVNGFLLAACLAKVDLNNYYQVSNVFYLQAVRVEVRSNAASRRLACRFLAGKVDDFNTLSQAVYQANYLGLTELVQETLKPAVVKQLDDAAKANDFNRLTQGAYLVSNLGLWDVAESRLRPILRKHAEAASTSGDLFKMQQLASMAQVLHMPEMVETLLRPAAFKQFMALGEKLNDMNSFYQARYLAQVMDLNEAFEAAVRPAAVRVIREAAQNPNDVNKFYTALNMAQNLNMQEALEGVLRPAGRRLILAALEQPGDWNKINQAVNLCRNLNIQDVLEDSVKPVFRKHAHEMIGKSPDLNLVNQLYNLAQNLQTPEVIEDHIKPALRKYFLAAKDQPLNQSFLYQGLYLARNLQLKEAVPYALKVSGSKEANTYARGLAIFFVGQFGTKQQLAQLEPLLSDKTDLGTSQVNWTTLRCQVRDAVLAAILTGHGQNLAEYGFPYFQMIQGIGLFQTSANCAGFSNDAGRDGAFKKYKQWRARQTNDGTGTVAPGAGNRS